MIMTTTERTLHQDFTAAATAWKTSSLRARYEASSFDGAVRSAVRFSRKNDNTPTFVYAGNSYGYGVYRVTPKERDARCPINNNRAVMYEVIGSEIYLHELHRNDAVIGDNG